MRALALLAAAAAMTAVAGCGDGDGDGDDTASPAASSSASTGSPRAVATEVETRSDDLHPSLSMRTPAQIPALDGDVDGDGEADDLEIAGSPGAWQVVVAGSADTSYTAPIDATESDLNGAPPSVAGVVDVDEDGYAEVFVHTAQGASTTFWTMYRVDGEALREVTLDGGHVRFGVGGSVTHGAGVACRDGRWIVSRVESDDGRTFRGYERTYRIEGATLRLDQERALTGQGQDDPATAAAFVADCRSLGE